MKGFLAAGFMIASMAAAHAAFLDGNKLREWCSSTEAGNQAACLGYVVGVADTLSADVSAGRRACIPDIEATQAVSTAKKYLETHAPDGSGASDLVSRALAESFPCP